MTWDECKTQFKRKHNFRQIEKSCFSCMHCVVCIDEKWRCNHPELVATDALGYTGRISIDGVEGCVCDAYESEVKDGK